MRLTDKAQKRRTEIINDSLFMEEAMFEPFDAGVALVCGPYVPSVAHLVRDVVEHVAVLLGTFQRELHRVLAPDLQQGASLLLRPGRLSTQVSLEEATAHQLFDWVQKQHVYMMDASESS